MAHAILRLPTVKQRCGLSRSTIYLRITQGAFPKPVSLGPRAVGWIEAENRGMARSTNREEPNRSRMIGGVHEGA